MKIKPLTEAYHMFTGGTRIGSMKERKTWN